MRLRYIRSAKALNLSLKDIGALRASLDRGPEFRAGLRGVVTRKSAELEAEIATLIARRDALDAFLAACSNRPEGTP